MDIFNIITNEKLRDLLLMSESVGMISGEQMVAFLTAIQALPEEGKQEVIKLLEREQEEIAVKRQAVNITEEDIKKAEAMADMAIAEERAFQARVRNKIEEKEQQKALTQVENLIK